MPIDPVVGGQEFKSYLISKAKPVISNPLVTGIFITICIVCIVLLVYTGDGYSIGKVAFWSVLVISTVLFLHDAIVAEDTKTIIGRREEQMMSILPPSALRDDVEISLPVRKRKLKLPSLSVSHFDDSI